MKKFIICVLVLFLPSFVLRPLLRLIGHKIGKRSKIGFSVITSRTIVIEDDVRIGHLNLILNQSIELSNNSIIGYLNIFKGPFKLSLGEKSAIGNKNYITRGFLGITYGSSELSLGKLTKITTGHHLDLTKNIKFGDYSILAGIRSQMWTHGYYHAQKGKDRIRIDGDISIGNNVYVGSGCVFNPGVSVYDAIHIGGGSVVSKDLTQEGMYVGQPMRFIKQNFEEVKEKLTKVSGYNLVEEVYYKNKNA